MVDNMLEFKIIMMGPSRVGKTTLITAIIEELTEFLKGTVVSIDPADPRTRIAVQDNRRDLQRELLAGEFSGGSLGGTQAVSEYRLRIKAGDKSGVDLTFLDFKGSWLDPKYRDDEQWQRVESFIAEATCMIVPTDSVVLMAAKTGRQRGQWVDLLNTVDVAEAAQQWSRGRLDDPEQPALFVLAPVKCETYFIDNGGRGPDLSDTLHGVVEQAYADTLAKVRDNAQHSRIVYAPVDSIGCVEVETVTWNTSDPSNIGPDVTYMTRGVPGKPVQRQPKGAEDIVRRVLQPLIDMQVKASGDGYAKTKRERDREIKERDERGFLRSAWEWITSEDEKRESRISSLEKQAQKEARHAEALRDALIRLGREPVNSRVREL